MNAVAGARLQMAAARASDELNAFVAWWLHELRDTWLAASERVAPARAQHFVVDLTGPRGAIRRQGSSESSIEFDCGSLDLPELQQVWPQSAPAAARATVLLPESSVLTCELRVPPVAERDVARAVELQLERKLPLPGEQLYVDWRVRESLPDRSRIVDVLIARRTVIDRMRDGVRAWGWRAVAITSKEPEGRQRFNLLPLPTRRLSFAVGTRERYLSWIAVALVFVYAAVAVGKGWLERSSVRDNLVHARTQTTHIEKQRALLAKEGKPIVLLDEVMRRPSAADGLIAVSTALPHDTWIYQADIRALASGVSMSLEGYTPSATSLLQGLQSSKRLDQIELIEATSAGVGSGSERVELKARVQGRATP